jgi:hypothetical protein
MLLISGYWGESRSFKLIPATQDCPYVEAMYDTNTGLLAVIGKTKKQIFHMVHKVDDNGDMVPMKSGKRENGKPYKEERRIIDTFHEYYIMEESEIVDFINTYAINSTEYDYMKYIDFTRNKLENPVAMENAPSISEIMGKVK